MWPAPPQGVPSVSCVQSDTGAPVSTPASASEPHSEAGQLSDAHLASQPDASCKTSEPPSEASTHDGLAASGIAAASGVAWTSRVSSLASAEASPPAPPASLPAGASPLDASEGMSRLAWRPRRSVQPAHAPTLSISAHSVRLNRLLLGAPSCVCPIGPARTRPGSLRLSRPVFFGTRFGTRERRRSATLRRRQRKSTIGSSAFLASDGERTGEVLNKHYRLERSARPNGLPNAPGASGPLGAFPRTPIRLTARCSSAARPSARNPRLRRGGRSDRQTSFRCCAAWPSSWG